MSARFEPKKAAIGYSYEEGDGDKNEGKAGGEDGAGAEEDEEEESSDEEIDLGEY